MNQASQTRGQFRYNRQQVLFLTGMCQDQYNNFQIDTGKAWVERYWQKIMDADALLNTTIFWQWWMYQWNVIDDKMILAALYKVQKPKRHSCYRQLHQYVFQEDCQQQAYLMHDFRHMRKQFEKAIKTPVNA